MPKKETANSVKPHTEAKLQFYTEYLERYLMILLRAPSVEQINIYDMFCGEGLYSDGNTGSAVRAVDAIWKAQAASNKYNKSVNLHLNDLNKSKVKKLKGILNSRVSIEKNFRITYSNLEALELLNKLPEGFRRQSNKIRNLVFIDPYGYKAINKSTLEDILIGGKTEVILFLPVEQMYRFKSKTLDEDIDSSYRPLKKFIESFYLDVNNIFSEKDFIKAIEVTLTFGGKLYATSYAIKNHTGHYYGMFFVTSNLLGLEKIVDVKWGLDKQQGEEFRGDKQTDFFLEMDKQEQLGKSMTEFLSIGKKTNIELHEYVVKLGFLSKHANKILRGWQDKGRLEKIDLIKNKPAAKNSFRLSYKDYKAGMPLISYHLTK